MSINIAILDDHPMIIQGITFLLNNNATINLVEGFTHSQQLFKYLEEYPTNFDVVLIDIILQETTGDVVVKEIRNNYPYLKTIAFTNQEQTYYINAMIANGANGYLLKTCKESTLIEAINKVFKGGIFYDSNINIHQNAVTKNLRSAEEQVNDREKKILELMAKDLTSVEIANEIFLSKKAVDYHRANLLLKFDVKTPAALIKKAIELGILKV